MLLDPDYIMASLRQQIVLGFLFVVILAPPGTKDPHINDCCAIHDRCYCEPHETQDNCDEEFCECLERVTSDSGRMCYRGVAKSGCRLVKRFGGRAFGNCEVPMWSSIIVVLQLRSTSAARYMIAAIVNLTKLRITAMKSFVSAWKEILLIGRGKSRAAAESESTDGQRSIRRGSGESGRREGGKSQQEAGIRLMQIVLLCSWGVSCALRVVLDCHRLEITGGESCREGAGKSQSVKEEENRFTTKQETITEKFK
uniref:GRANULINS domain-containing protein n=1 Tax=Steinernema glaseri TaxID=37863 RepID=A0A1I7YUS2_9BILA